MFSYSDLVGHSCSTCLKAISIVHVKEPDLEGDCLWFLLAQICFDWAATITQTRPTWMDLEREGRFCIFYDDEEVVGPLERHFEYFLTNADASESVSTPCFKRHLPGETSSTSTINTIRGWMSECTSDHSKCQWVRAQQRELSGIRFLRIENGYVTLTEGVTPERYACLSYCWGDGKNVIKTTIQNRSAHIKTGVKVENLSNTYQDALIVCKELGIEYIWIDSLCIVQDDDEDWRSQASRMAYIYENAYVTIAAVAAQNTFEGMFNTTSKSRMGSSLPELPWINVREMLRLPNTRSEDYRSRTDDGWALYKRGWTFQELRFSTRVLHFGSEEVLWSCKERQTSEGNPDKTALLPLHVSISPPIACSPSQVTWCSIVTGYSWRNLTFGKDRLPAIAAFASCIQAHCVENRYIAGLWQDTLLLDLLWSCYEGKNQLKPTYPVEPGTIPSWTWASSIRPVHWMWVDRDLCQGIPCTQVIKVTYNTQGPPTLGDIIEAFLVLQAPMIRLCKINDRERGPSLKYVSYAGVAPGQGVTLSNYKWDDLQPCSHYHANAQEALAIPLVAPRLGSIQDSSRNNNALLVVEECPGVYRRAGVGRIDLSSDLAERDRVRGTSLEQTWSERERQVERNRRFVEVMDRCEKRILKLV